MAERTIAKPLSGAEIVEAVVVKLRESMRVDCRLQPHMAYGAFSVTARVDIKFSDPHGSGETATAHEVTVAQGEVEEDAFPLHVEIESRPIEFSQDQMPPNQVRMESGQGIPTLVTLPGGKTEEKKITYRDPEFVAKAKGRPKGKGK